MVTHGKGNQYWMTEDFESHRQKALEDNTTYSNSDNIKYEVYSSSGQGGGRTNPEKYEINQQPLHDSQKIRKKEKFDYRSVLPQYD